MVGHKVSMRTITRSVTRTDLYSSGAELSSLFTFDLPFSSEESSPCVTQENLVSRETCNKSRLFETLKVCVDKAVSSRCAD